MSSWNIPPKAERQNRKAWAKHLMRYLSRPGVTIWIVIIMGLVPVALLIQHDDIWRNTVMSGLPVVNLLDARASFTKAYQRSTSATGDIPIKDEQLSEILFLCRQTRENLLMASTGRSMDGKKISPPLDTPEITHLITELQAAVDRFLEIIVDIAQRPHDDEVFHVHFQNLEAAFDSFESSAMAARRWIIKEIHRETAAQKKMFLATLTAWVFLWLGLGWALTSAARRNRRTEAKFDQSRQLFDKAFSMSPFWVILTTLEEGRYLEVNQAFLKACGYTRDEVIGKTSLELQTWVDPAERARLVEALRIEGKLRDHESLIRLKKNETRNVLMYVDLISLEGSDYILSIILDITERKMLEEQLGQSRKMEALGTMASGIAHDFNNILQAMNGFLHLLPKGSQLDSNQLACLHELEQSTERASDLVRRILTFSRKLKPRMRVLDLNRETENTIRMLRQIMPRMIEIVSRLDNELTPVLGDTGLLEQVLMNLGANARDAMPHGGRLLIRTRNTRLDSGFCRAHPDLEPGDFVALEISDNGMGMAEETMERIFEPFFTTKDVDQGTGLGLSTVYGIVKQHGGCILCQSALGRGTSFTILLPAVLGGTPSKAPNSAAGRKTTSLAGSIMLVDDEPAILNTVGAALRLTGFTVIEAENGEKAIERLDEHQGKVDLVMLDLGMPGMGGLQCLRQIKVLYPGLTVLVASGYNDMTSRSEAISGGAADFLAKPYSMSDLIAKLEEMLPLHGSDS